jgi:phenylacetate-CoA ligase
MYRDSGRSLRTSHPIAEYLEEGRHTLRRAAAHLSPAEVVSRGDAAALETFHLTALTVRGYRHFLETHGVRASDIRTIDDLRQVPFTTKQNYLDLYPLVDLVPDGDLTRMDVFNTSSGTTGKSYLWPISTAELLEGAQLYEFVFDHSFSFERRRTLLVVCFAMGTWIAGSFTSFSSFLLKQHGYPFSIVTPGYNKEDTLRIIREFGSQFDQIVVAGIPTFLKDLFESIHEDPALRARSFRALFAGEGFSEHWRTHVCGLMSQDDPAACTASVYGSADAAIKGFEAPETIRFRRVLSADPSLCRSLFGQERAPSLFHHVPWLRHFDTHEGELLVTARRGIPLVRYNLHDEGGVLPAPDWSGLPFPLVFLFGREKFATTLFGANIYAESVRDALLAPELSGRITGKFSMQTEFDERYDQRLHLHVELAGGQGSEGLPGAIRELCFSHLLRVSSEYRCVYQDKGERAKPHVSLHPSGDPAFFASGRIQKCS